MTNFERKRLEGLCTFPGCTAPGEHFSVDVDEPHGAKLHQCTTHDELYKQRLELEEA